MTYEAAVIALAVLAAAVAYGVAILLDNADIRRRTRQRVEGSIIRGRDLL